MPTGLVGAEIDVAGNTIEGFAQAIVDPLSVSGIFYLNLNPTPDDITDKSGQGNHPTWFTAERASLWQEAT